MTLQNVFDYFGSEAAFGKAMNLTPKQVARIDTDAHGQVLDRALMDRILATIVRHKAAARRAAAEPLDPIEDDLTTI